jgi:WD40 repeat protein
MIYTAVDNVVSGYDLRMATSPIVTNEIAQDVSGLRATDEINHISVFVKQPSSPIQKQERRPFRSRKKSNSTNHSVPTTNTSSPPMFYLATADDAGFVRVMTDVTNATDLDGTETEHMPSVQVYPHGNPEDAPAMVTSLAFCPNPSRKHPSTFLASGGTDCRICLWNLDMNSNKHPHHPVATITFDFTTNNNNNDAQICNPPFVHSLHWSPSGRLLAAGLGDGSIGILQFTPASSSLILSARMDNAHGNAVASCLFPMWRGQQETTIAPAAAAAAAAAVETTIQHTQNSMAAQDRLLCTAGNDGRLVFWDLGSILCGEKANDPMLSFFSNHTRPCDNVVTEWDDHQPRTLFAIAHGKKPNWLVSSGSHCCAEAFPSSVFVADVSSDITVYTIPTS